MNKKFLSFLLLVSACFLISCQHDGVYDPDARKEPVKVTELNVPDDFNWEMSKDVSVSISAPIESAVSIYADEECRTLLATLPVGPIASIYNLSVNTATEQLYVQYPDQEGTKQLKAYILSGTKAAADVAIKLPEDLGQMVDQYGECVMNYPQAAWGTLLFEDMWPRLGDYDFNDLAAWYKIQLQDINEEAEFSVINMGLRLNALGGHLPYQLCLQIDDLQSKEIEGIECVDRKGETLEGILVWDSEGKEGPAIFSFNWENKKRSNGGDFFNTEKKYKVAPTVLDSDQVNIIIDLKNGKKLSQVQHTSFNFFIRKEDGTEIHLKGYKPTAAFQERYNQIVKENPELNPEIPYCTQKNFVWGIKVPQGIDHAAETVNFTKAYTIFGEWVETGGTNDRPWYSPAYKNPANCISVH